MVSQDSVCFCFYISLMSKLKVVSYFEGPLLQHFCEFELSVILNWDFGLFPSILRVLYISEMLPL